MKNNETMFANLISYSDVYPYEVIRQVSPKCLEVRAMAAELDSSWKPEFVSGGFAGHCRYGETIKGLLKITNNKGGNKDD